MNGDRVTMECWSCRQQGLVCTHLGGAVSAVKDGRPHRVPCVCTVDSRSGAIRDYDCGRQMDEQSRAESARRESELRADLTERLRVGLQSGLDGAFLDPAEDESMQLTAEVAVGVFVEWLREARTGGPDSGPWATWGGDGVGP